MYVTLPKFRYHEPQTLLEAAQLLAREGPSSRVLAGGCDLLPELRTRAVRLNAARTPAALISLHRIAGLQRIELAPKATQGSESEQEQEQPQKQTARRDLVVYPMASLRSVERFAPVRIHWPALFEGINGIASVQVRTGGTLIGNLCVATPASDVALPLLVYGARVTVFWADEPVDRSTAGSADGSNAGSIDVSSAGGKQDHAPGGEKTGKQREFPLADLFVGAKQHCLKPGELVTAVRIPSGPPSSGSAFAKLTRTTADCAKVNAAALVALQGGQCHTVRIALGSVAPTPVRAARAEQILQGTAVDGPELDRAIARASAAAAADLHPIDDVRSTAAYRKQTVGVLVEQVCRRALKRARSEKE